MMRKVIAGKAGINAECPAGKLVRSICPHIYILALLFAILLCPSVNRLLKAENPDEPGKKDYYEDKVQSILNSKCTSCHDADTKEAGLDLSSPQGIINGSESGNVVQAGDPESSLIIQMVQSGEMPPDEAEHLTEDELSQISNWIRSGARFRESVELKPEVSQHDIIPLLHLRCVACHGGRIKEADLDLRTKESILKGSKSGPVVIPGNPGQSRLIQKIIAEEMPPRRELVSASVKPMEANELKLLSKWIELELPEIDLTELESTESPIKDEDRKFWSFQPPSFVAPPR
ncbi:MAG: c-type cytochrome domain-containing protein [Planctomycetaceae bacterium]